VHWYAKFERVIVKLCRNKLRCPCQACTKCKSVSSIFVILCAAGHCAHTWLVLLFLSPFFLNWSGFRDLSRGTLKAAAESDSDSDDESDPLNPSERDYVAKYTYDVCRYDEEDRESRDKDKNWRLLCNDVACAEKATCEHVFPREFRPSAHLAKCPRCSMCNASVLFELSCPCRQGHTD
jgi:hypothetical protein